MELLVKDDMVWFSEVSPRPHDTGMFTLITQYQNEFECMPCHLGLPVNVTQRDMGASAVIYAGVEKALQVPNTDIRLFGGKPEGFIKRRMGVALAFADDINTARDNAKLASSYIQSVVTK